MKRTTVAATIIALTSLAGCGSSYSGGNGSSAASSGSASSASAAAPGGSAYGTSSAAPAASTPAAGSSGVSLTADPSGQLKFDAASLTAKAGRVAIRFTNMAPEDHNLTIASSSGQVLGATPTFHGATKTLTLALKPGRYVYYCSVPGHRMAGMQGTLTVG